MGRKLINMTGKRVGRLTIVEYIGNEMWRCRCDCGNEIIRRGATLRKMQDKVVDAGLLKYQKRTDRQIRLI